MIKWGPNLYSIPSPCPIIASQKVDEELNLLEPNGLMQLMQVYAYDRKRIVIRRVEIILGSALTKGTDHFWISLIPAMNELEILGRKISSIIYTNE